MLKLDEILRLHTDRDGIVWCGQSGIQAYCSKRVPAEFVFSPMFHDAKHIRVLGVDVNAELICLLHDARLRLSQTQQAKQKLQIGNPGCCFQKPFIEDPVFVLQQMWQATTSAMSRWHDLSGSDYTCYSAIVSLAQTGCVDDKVSSIIKYHPAWHALTFALTHDLDAGCRLVCEIIDPRWYNHPSRPDRATRLMTHLGLYPSNFEISANTTNQFLSRKRELSRLVLRAWAGGSDGSDVDIGHPRNFLWRIFRKKGGGPRGLLQACRVFVELVRYVWLHNVAQPGRRVFRPAMFFKFDPQEIFAYKTHVGCNS